MPAYGVNVLAIEGLDMSSGGSGSPDSLNTIPSEGISQRLRLDGGVSDG